MKNKIVVGITGLNAIDSPGPGISVIRSLKQSSLFEIRIIGLVYETLEPGIYMHDWVDKSYQIPLPSAGVDSLWTRLQEIHAAEKLDLVIPNFDSELYNFIQLKQKLHDIGIASFIPTHAQFEKRNKTNLIELCRACNVYSPETIAVNSLSDLKSVISEWTFPFMIKGRYYEAIRVFSETEALGAFHKLANTWGLPVLIQKTVLGEEVNVTAIGDGQGLVLGAVGMKKLYITDKGKAWSGISIWNKDLLDLSAKIIEHLQWPGGIELEWIKGQDGTYHLLEINPRFPAWIYLATGCGQNHPEILVRLALGEKVIPLNQYDAGKLFIRYSYDMVVDLSEYEQITTRGEL